MISSKRIRLMGGYKGILDELGIVNNCVLAFSLYLLTNRHKGYCLRVIRESDSQALNIGFVDGFIDVASLEAFCIGTNGFVDIWHNQSQAVGATNALQTTPDYRPKIVNSGSLLTDGLYFDDNYLTVVDYSAIQILNPPLTFYSNTYVTSHNTGFIFAKNYNLTNTAIRVYHSSSGVIYTVLDATSIGTSINSQGSKIISSWASTGTNDFKIKSDISENTSTFSGTLTNYTDNTIGARENSGSKSTFLRGYIKTLLIFNSNEYDNYTDLSNNC